jgi:hypothetical protein
MTAEIGILNMSGVALAADSAVTIGSKRNQKVYNSANKLFALSKYHPVGIMIYGAAHFNGVPWEIIIKEFRKSLGKQKFDYLEQYSNKFFEYLKENEELNCQYAEDNQVKGVFQSYLNGILYDIDIEINEAFPEESASEEEALDILIKRLDILLTECNDIPFLDGLDEHFIELFKKVHNENIKTVLKHNIFIEISEHTIETFIELAAQMFAKEFVSDKVSGIVITGYGENEIYPSMFEYETEGMFCGFIKISQQHQTRISSGDSEGTSASIRAFAQKEMVETFMHGIDPRMEDAIIEGLAESLEEVYPSLLAETLGIELSGEQVKALNKLGESFIESFIGEIERIKREYFINPIVDTVDLLPKEELAAMAEALVNLTSFKRKITIDAETVGGPIDVAVISKGDGFVWIKRKHYFKPELNYHFFQNYTRGENYESDYDN